jgi:hypothetical protein
MGCSTIRPARITKTSAKRRRNSCRSAVRPGRARRAGPVSAGEDALGHHHGLGFNRGDELGSGVRNARGKTCSCRRKASIPPMVPVGATDTTSGLMISRSRCHALGHLRIVSLDWLDGHSPVVRDRSPPRSAKLIEHVCPCSRSSASEFADPEGDLRPQCWWRVVGGGPASACRASGAGLTHRRVTGRGHRGCQRPDRLGDCTAHRRADDVRAVEPERIEQPRGVGGHVRERVGGGRQVTREGGE